PHRVENTDVLGIRRRRPGRRMAPISCARRTHSGESMASKKSAAAAAKPKALSVHLGLNAVSADHYGGWSGELAACEFDANDMAAIAKAKGMKPTVLLTKKATRANA